MKSAPVNVRSSFCRRFPALLSLCALTGPLWAAPSPGERETPLDQARPTQQADRSPPPAASRPDPGAPLPALPPIADPSIRFRREITNTTAAEPPPQFNPDPGADKKPAVKTEEPYFKSNQVTFGKPQEEWPVPQEQALPRYPLVRPSSELNAGELPPPKYGLDPLPADQALPRAGVRANRYIPTHFEAPEGYEESARGEGLLPNTKVVQDRWRSTGFVPWRRTTGGDPNESPFFYSKPEVWHWYRQSILKGDLPIRGQETFLSLTAESETVYEDRKLTTPSTPSASRVGSFENFGQSRSQVFVENFSIKALLFKGETVFKPVEWAIFIHPVFNVNRVAFHETVVSPDPRGSVSAGIGSQPNNGFVTNPSDIDILLGNTGAVAQAPTSFDNSKRTTRTKNYISLQEFFFEKHLRDLSSNYDFCAIKFGNQTLNTDFRGFIFNDTNLGVRFFGNYDSNRWQYNAAVFDLREKDSNTDLNTFDRRGQVVVVANVYRQDFRGWHGYTLEGSFHASFDQASGPYYDTNGGIVRPSPLGGPIVPHRVNSYYLGVAGDGHLGRINISHAAYVAFGRDDANGLAGRAQDIFAQMAAAEVSYDRDWLRYKASFLWASGDHDPTDRRATGFDSILDNTNFTGGPFSYYVRQGFNLGGTAVGLKQRFSVFPDLRTSKTQGQQNFVNPGLQLLSLGADADLTPRLKGFFNTNYIRFDTTSPLKTALLTNQVGKTFGTDISLGFQWRPLLTDNIIISAGYATLLPGSGFRDIYRAAQPGVPGFTDPKQGAEIDHRLYSTTLAVTLTY